MPFVRLSRLLRKQKFRHAIQHSTSRRAVSLIEPLEARQLMSTYYVSPSGSDNSNGTSSSSPWKTIAKVNNASMKAGDTILFQGGATFDGGLSFFREGGTASSPITISSYGSGRATIRSGSSAGIMVTDCAGFDVKNLNVVGNGRTNNNASGIEFYTALGGGVKLDHITIDNVESSGYGVWGIRVGGWNGTSAFKNIRVTNSNLHDNGWGGFYTYAQSGKSNQNVYVSRVIAHDNPGVPGYTANSTGNGIELSYVDGATVERCVAYNNGSLNGASVGPVGIWAWFANNVVIQNSEAHHNHTGGHTDGGGFDFDGMVTNSVMQYNYSHDNDGSGYLLCQFGSSAWSNNVVRYNVTQNDGRKNSYAPIFTWSSITNADIYDNTIYLSPASTGSPVAVNLSAGTNVSFRNNIVVTTGGMTLLKGSNGTNRFVQGNNWYTSGGAFNINWGGNYTSLAAFQAASGQEKLNGTSVGMSVDPKLVNPGGGTTLNNADMLESSLGAYKLQSSSPLISKGLNLKSVFGTSTGSRDFFADALPTTGFDIGADEFLGGGTSDTTAPTMPTSLVATPSTSGIALDWANNTESDLAGYNVYWSNSSTGTFTKINASLLTTSAFTDAAAPSGVASFYRVTAVDSSGNESSAATTSATRPTATDTTPPAVPTGLTATGKTSEILLDWADNTETDFAGYNAYRSSSATGTFTKVNASPFLNSVYDDTNAPVGVATFYRITAVDKTGNESAAATANATRPATTTTDTKVVGTAIGTSGSYNNLGNTIAKAFDGDTTTYFDGPTSSGNWLGLDLGSAMQLSRIRYVPRINYANRMLNGKFQASNTADFSSGVVDLFTITTTPAAGWNEQTIANTNAYRYVRYLSPSGSYGNVAEIEVYTPTATTFTGTPIGTAGSYNNLGNTIAKVFDGDTSTYFDSPAANKDNAWVGLDLGTAKTIQHIRFAPRAGYEQRMVGGIFQVSNTADFSSGVVNLYTITAKPASGWNQIDVTSPGSYRYVRYLAPTGSYGNVAELEFS